MSYKTLIIRPGNKAKFAKQIVSYMPTHTGYIEPFVGSASIITSKPRATFEVINDKYNDIINLFRVARDMPEKLTHLLEYGLQSEAEFNYLKHIPVKDLGMVDRAYRYLYMNRQSFSGKDEDTWAMGNGTTSKFVASNMIKAVKKYHTRLVGVHITCRDYAKLLKYGTKDTLWYLDPPYLSTTGYKDSIIIAEFVKFCNSIKGKVLISHEYNKRFHRLFSGWHCVSIGTRVNSLGLKVKRRRVPELLYANYPLEIRRRELF